MPVIILGELPTVKPKAFFLINGCENFRNPPDTHVAFLIVYDPPER